MSTAQNEKIAALRRENYSYRFIGDALRLSPNTVKSICRRNHYKADGRRKTKAEKEDAPLCKYCHGVLSEGRKDRAFCSDGCRTKWWRENRKVTEKQP